MREIENAKLGSFLTQLQLPPTTARLIRAIKAKARGRIGHSVQNYIFIMRACEYIIFQICEK